MTSTPTVTGKPEADITNTVAKLWGAHEIRQLAYRFALAHDSRDLAEMEHLFVPADEPLIWPEFNIVNARKRFPEYFTFAGPTMLLVANHIIEFVDETHATGSVYCLCKLDLAGSWIEVMVLYLDVYEQYEGTWRFKSRRHLMWYGVELPERPFEQEKTTWPISALGRGSLPEDFEAWRAWNGIAEAPTGYYGQP